ncbi:MAG TPA: GntR family transcriptional regulator [Bryobacteraceae bacterium]|nr:GntR family transcriptional regulator [Bryobacteraceae bacterium]
MKKLKIPSNLTTLAYNSIKEYILEGRLDENSRLTEEFLSTQLGISKSPIREALNRLETEGLIRIEPRKGAYLRRLAAEEVTDLYDLREALETHVMRTAKLTPVVLTELQQSLKRQRAFLKANDRTHYIEEDVHFHAELARATGNSHLCAVLENIQNQIWLSRRNTYDLSSSTAPDYHQAIVDALEANQRDKAEAAMRDHIQNVKRRLVEFLESSQVAEQVG